MPKPKDYHAKLVIHGLPDMKSATYRRLVDWLQAQVKNLKAESKDSKVFAKTYTARFMK